MKTMKFNKSQILKKAWQLFKVMVAKDENNRTDKTFADCLIVSWAMAKTIPCIDINELYKKYYSPILNFIMQMLHNSNNAEELANDTFIKAMDKMYQFNPENLVTK
jgi:hypothetical protein